MNESERMQVEYVSFYDEGAFDAFAAAAMQGMIAMVMLPPSDIDMAKLRKAAYDMAEEMMRERIERRDRRRLLFPHDQVHPILHDQVHELLKVHELIPSQALDLCQLVWNRVRGERDVTHETLVSGTLALIASITLTASGAADLCKVIWRRVRAEDHQMSDAEIAFMKGALTTVTLSPYRAEELIGIIRQRVRPEREG